MIAEVTNNPGNIRKSGSRWLGSCGSYKGFVKFKSVEYGVRALLITLKTYRYKYRLLSPMQIISRYAPPSENRTDFYIDYICAHLVVRRTSILSEHQMFLLALYMMYFETSPSYLRSVGVDLPYILGVAEKYNIHYGCH